ncbi:MAG: PQQ-binding-like beta-propeller repeat protein [Burkholderiales bacterium]|nr:PQQ-binding-like beta-propeller repeat protein [Burkholderiales bacterium]
MKSSIPAAGKYALCAVVALSGCGGGGGGGGGTSLAPTTFTLVSKSISRHVPMGTSATIDIQVKPSSPLNSALYAKVTDSNGITTKNISIIQNSDNSYTLSLITSNTAKNQKYTGTFTFNFCQDSACITPSQLPAISVPYTINIMATGDAWPGNNLTALASWNNVPDWSMFQGNAAHTGYVPVVLDPNNFSTRWKTASNCIAPMGAARIPCGTITTGGQRLYVAGTNGTQVPSSFGFTDSDHTLFALNEYDASIVWQYDFLDLPINPPSNSNDSVYVVAGQQGYTQFFALNAKDGTLSARSQMVSQWESYLAPTITAQGIYTDGGAFGGLYAFKPNGDQMFFGNLAGDDSWTPAVDSTGVYAYSGGVLTAFDPIKGTSLHSIKDPTYSWSGYSVGGSPVIGAPGSIILANYLGQGNALVDFDVNHDRVSWSVTGLYRTTPAYNAGVIYAANLNPNRLEARSEADGSLLWAWIPPSVQDTNYVSEVLLTSNLAFVSTNQNTYAIDLNSHKMVWGCPYSGHLALSASGILYIESDRSLIAVNVK